MLIRPAPWQFSDGNGLEIGAPLSEPIKRRLNLTPDELDDDEGCDWWSDPAGHIRVAICGGLVGLVNRRCDAVLGGVNLLGLTKDAVVDLLGSPTRVDSAAVSFDYCDGQWELNIGFFDDRSMWAAISNGDVLERPSP